MFRANYRNVTQILCSCILPLDSPWDLNEEGMKGLRCILLNKLYNNQKVRMRSRERYLQVLTGAEDITFLDNPPDEDDYDYDSDSDFSEDE